MFTILRGLYYFPPLSSKLDQSLLYCKSLDFVALYLQQESITHRVTLFLVMLHIINIKNALNNESIKVVDELPLIIVCFCF